MLRSVNMLILNEYVDVGIATAMLSVRPSARPSGTLMYHSHIGRVTWKVITSLLGAPISAILSKGYTPNLGGIGLGVAVFSRKRNGARSLVGSCICALSIGTKINDLG